MITSACRKGHPAIWQINSPMILERSMGVPPMLHALAPTFHGRDAQAAGLGRRPCPEGYRASTIRVRPKHR